MRAVLKLLALVLFVLPTAAAQETPPVPEDSEAQTAQESEDAPPEEVDDAQEEPASGEEDDTYSYPETASGWEERVDALVTGDDPQEEIDDDLLSSCC